MADKKILNDVIKVFKVDKYTSRLIELTAKAEGVTDSEWLRSAVRDKIHREMIKGGMGISYYAAVQKLIKELEAKGIGRSKEKI